MEEQEQSSCYSKVLTLYLKNVKNGVVSEY